MILRLDFCLAPWWARIDPIRWVVQRLIEAGAPVRFKVRKYFDRYEESDIELLGTITTWDDHCTRETVWEWKTQNKEDANDGII